MKRTIITLILLTITALPALAALCNTSILRGLDFSNKAAFTTDTLQQWYSWADDSEIKPIQEVAKLMRHEDNILTYFDMPISNGIAECLNNKSKVNSHRAYGFKTAMNYILNLYH